LPWCLWPIVGCEGRREVGAKPGQPRRKRRSSSREAEGTPDGFREAVYCWTAAQGWPYCWIRSLSNCCGFFCTHKVLCYILLYSCKGVMFPVISYLWHVWEDMLCCWSISYLSERTVLLDISIALMHVRLYLRFLNHNLSFLFQEDVKPSNSKFRGLPILYGELYIYIYIYIYIYLVVYSFQF
jgi:hypothetical protein